MHVNLLAKEKALDLVFEHDWIDFGKLNYLWRAYFAEKNAGFSNLGPRPTSGKKMFCRYFD